MEEAARKRKERLQALREGAPLSQVEEPKEDIVTKLAYIKADEEKEKQPDEPTYTLYHLEEYSNSSYSFSRRNVSIFAGDATLEAQVAYLMQEAKSLSSIHDGESGSRKVGGVDEVTLEDLAPRKATWDLKEDYEKRTATLQKQYERACAELIRTYI